MDTNKDGVITLEEFLGRTDGRFARLDKNGDGFIDASDLAAAAKEDTEYRIKRFLKMFDTNRDGKVTKEEFEQRAKDRFAMRDLNSDGEIGVEDLPPDARPGSAAEHRGEPGPGARGQEPAALRSTVCWATDGFAG
jgi:Ca2+-binding EF-hand superfamily protein